MDTEPLYLLHPELVPKRRYELTKAGLMLAQMGMDDSLLHAPRIYQRLARVVLASGDVIERAIVGAYTAPEREEYDRNFGVTRVGGDLGGVFLSGLLITYLDMHDNVARMGTRLSDDDWQALLGAPTALFDFALCRPKTGSTAATAPSGGEYVPYGRWQAGHRQYFALVQAVRFALGCVLRAIDVRDEPGTAEAIALASAQIRAATVALKLAADLRPEDYADRIKPGTLPLKVGSACAPPETKDHGYLWLVLGRVRSALSDRQYEEFAAAVTQLSEAHT